MSEKQKTFRFGDGTWLIITHRGAGDGREEVRLEAKIQLDLCVHTLLDFGACVDDAEGYFDLVNEGNAEAIYSNLRLSYRNQVDKSIKPATTTS